VKDRELNACVLTPKGTPSPAARPIVVWVYPDINAANTCNAGGPYGSGDGPSYATRLGEPDIYGADYIATLGYTVVIPSTPLDMINSPGEALSGYNDVIEPAVDAAAAQGLGDGNRVGVFGMSYGGLSVLKVITQGHRYLAAVAMNSDADFASDYATFGSTRAMLASQIFSVGKALWFTDVHQAKTTPWHDPDWFVRSSPYFASERITTPLMLVQADLDTNFQMSQFDEIYTSLYAQRKEVDYVRYWGEGHGVRSPANLRDLDQRVRRWFAERLGGG
jgi:dienelactone hydrolase